MFKTTNPGDYCCQLWKFWQIIIYSFHFVTQMNQVKREAGFDESNFVKASHIDPVKNIIFSVHAHLHRIINSFTGLSSSLR